MSAFGARPARRVGFAKLFELPAGAAGGILAGSMTMSAAIGSAEKAVRQGAFKLAEGQTFEQVSGMIALSYGITYIWGTVGIILICKYLPRWWGVDAKAAAKQYEEENGVPNVETPASPATGRWRCAPTGSTNERRRRQDRSRQFLRDISPVQGVVNVVRGDERIGADADDLVFAAGRHHRARRPAREP